MSQPNPVIIKFLTEDLDGVLKAMKSIEEVVTRTEKKSVAAVKAGAKAREDAHEKEAKTVAKQASETADALAVSERAGTTKLSAELRTRLQNQTKHLTSIYDASLKNAKKIEEAANTSLSNQLKALRKDYDDRQALRAKDVAEEKAAAERIAQDKIAAMKVADKELAKAQTKGEAEARKVIARENAAARAITREQNRARLEIQSGSISAAPHLSPQARLSILREAKHKSPEEQMKAVEKVRDLVDENRARLPKRKKALAEIEDAEKKHTKNLEDEEKRRASIREKSATMAGQFAKKQAAEQAAERSRLDSIRDRSATMAGNFAKKQAQEEAAQRKQYARTVFGAGTSALKSAGGIASSAARSFLNVGGGFSVEDSLQRELAFRGRAASIAATTNTGLSQANLMNHARSVGVANAMDPEEVLKAYEAVKKLNDESLPQAIRVMPHMAQIAAATGTDMGQLGELAANITAGDKDFFNNKNISAEEKDARLTRQLRVFTRQGIEGGVEITDFAKYGARITAGATLFGGPREVAEADLGQAAQIARQSGGAASAAEATLAAQRFATDLQKKAGFLKDNFKIDVADKNGSLRDLADITVDMLKQESRVTGISEFKIGERGNRYLTGAADVFRKAGGGEAGEKAVRSMFANGRKEITEQAVVNRAKQRNAEVDKQIEIAMIQLRTEVGTKLLPVLPPLIQSFTKLVPFLGMMLDKLAAVANWASTNPFGGFATLVGGFFIKELAAAKIGDVIKKMITGEGSGGGGVPGGGSTVAGKAIGMGLLTAGVVAKAQLGYSEGQEVAQDLRAKVEAYQRGDTERGISPEAAQKIVADAQKRLEKTSSIEQAANLATSPFVEASDRDYKKFKGDQGLVESEEGKRLLKEIADAIHESNRKAEMNMPATPTSAGTADPAAPSRQGGPVGRRPGG